MSGKSVFTKERVVIFSLPLHIAKYDVFLLYRDSLFKYRGRKELGKWSMLLFSAATYDIHLLFFRS